MMDMDGCKALTNCDGYISIERHTFTTCWHRISRQQQPVKSDLIVGNCGQIRLTKPAFGEVVYRFEIHNNLTSNNCIKFKLLTWFGEMNKVFYCFWKCVKFIQCTALVTTHAQTMWTKHRIKELFRLISSQGIFLLDITPDDTVYTRPRTW